MDTDGFLLNFEARFSKKQQITPSSRFCLFGPRRQFYDPCPDIAGMASPKKLLLLNLAATQLPENGHECYLEVGVYQGKSLIAALINNRNRIAVGCDNFSEFDDSSGSNLNALNSNLARHGMQHQVRFYNESFQSLFQRWEADGLPPIGAYFYDGAHDELSQYEALRQAEPLLSDNALVIVDDWRHAEDSGSFAETGSRRAITESQNEWVIRYVLPARRNGDVALWWNGVAVLTFHRRTSTQSHSV